VKGEVERDLKLIGYQQLAIHRPGMLLNRDGEKRFVEWIGSKIPFIPKIESVDEGLCMLDHAIKGCKKGGAMTTGKVESVLSNSEMKAYVAGLKD
jgi:hypothetical protein